jgi:hypothetical protein
LQHPEAEKGTTTKESEMRDRRIKFGGTRNRDLANISNDIFELFESIRSWRIMNISPFFHNCFAIPPSAVCSPSPSNLFSEASEVMNIEADEVMIWWSV